MESEQASADARSQLDALTRARGAALEEVHQRSEWWAPWVAATVGPMFVAAETLDGAPKFLVFGGFLLVLAAIAVREAKRSRVRRRLGPLPGRLGWYHFGFLFVLIVSLQLGEHLVDRMHNGLLAVLSYLAYLAFFSLWVVVFDRMIDTCAVEQSNQ